MPAPKYLTIKQYLFNEIASGRWTEHHKVPSENQLATQFSVSRMTARRALQELTEEGALVRTKGLGSFVASFKNQSSLLKVKNIVDEIELRGMKHSCELVTLEKRSSNPEVSVALSLPLESPVFFAALIHYQDRQPIQLEARYVNARLVPNFIEQDFTKITPHEYLAKTLPLTEAEHVVEAVLADRQVLHYLKLNPPQACLQLTRRSWSSLGVVSFTQLTHPGQHYRMGSQARFGD
ncbi:histidine utilization repressor [Echinimonas agarilytica]|uniref:Histidine utilization repressor n=1 Tax=Echinimonas agarilytica TaxID=1215918 RepID=A0AA41W6H6_9GAMM|nr:histidine utilization repressor [Echinimonas agarilytica]MCM2679965.1 histidine utilization repressor [Echinimonas agarilytica]